MTRWEIVRYRLHAHQVNFVSPISGKRGDLGTVMGAPADAIAHVHEHMEPGDLVVTEDGLYWVLGPRSAGGFRN